MSPDRRDFRLSLLVGAFGLTLLALAGPSVSFHRPSFDTLAVVDITGSMNTRDYLDGGRPVSRLEHIKSTLRDLVGGLPCGSRVALGVFSERRSFLLFEPLEVCDDYAPLAGAIEALDWRMAWEGDSRISSGLFRAIGDARELGVNLMFFTDGQEAPPLPISGSPPFEGRIGGVRGLIVGVGGYELSPIPKFDDNGREIGFYGAEDVPHENHFGLPPPGAEEREGYNARNAPFGAAVAVGLEHLSSVREPYLLSLSERTGLSYAHLTDAHRLLGAFKAAAAPQYRSFPQSLRPALGGAAAALLIGLYILLPAFESLERKRRAGSTRTQRR
ncbi:vWA domain-containing protein [Methylocystis heyeri]|uniref:vWA domain-containing protein n=1 Tax=Methylocystis heyeri TaxID=391905 RepID=UPI003CCE35C7